MPSMEYKFDWDTAKANANVRKHGVHFMSARSVFLDPLALTRHDTEHGEAEERWVTLGQNAEAVLLLVAHTLNDRSEREVHVRIISVRRPTADERRQYETGRYRIQEPSMQDEYDFSGAERGKFYREGAILIGPVHVEPDVCEQISRLAEKKGQWPSDLANEILRRAIAEMKTEG